MNETITKPLSPSQEKLNSAAKELEHKAEMDRIGVEGGAERPPEKTVAEEEENKPYTIPSEHQIPPEEALRQLEESDRRKAN